MGDAGALFAVLVVLVVLLWLGVRMYNARLAARRVWRRVGTQGEKSYKVFCKRWDEYQLMGEIANDDPDFENKLYELRVVADERATVLNGD